MQLRTIALYGMLLVIGTAIGSVIVAHVIVLREQKSAANEFWSDVQYSLKESSPARESTSSRLSFAVVLIERTPIFGLESVDLSALRTGADNLDQTARALAQQNGSTGANIIQNALYPTRFLRAVATAEADRRAFIENPSEQSLQNYFHSSEIALNAYGGDIDMFTSAFKREVPAEGSFLRFGTFGGIVTRDRELLSLQSLRSAADDARTRLHNQERCLIGELYACRLKDILLTVQVPLETIQKENLLSQGEHMANVLENVSNDADALNNLVLLENSSCVTGNVSPLFSMVDIFGTGSPEIEFVGDIFFESAQKGPPTEFLKYFAEHGVPYVRYSPMFYYTCPNILNDVGRISALRDARSLAETHILGRIFPDDTFLSQIESTVADEKILREDDVVSYLNEAARKINIGAMKSDEMKQFEPLIHSYNNRSAGLNYIVQQIFWSERTNAHLRESGIPISYNPSYLFAVRSGFFSLFMGATFSQESDVVSPVDPVDTLQSGPFISYSSLTEKEQAVAFENMKIIYELHKKAGSP